MGKMKFKTDLKNQVANEQNVGEENDHILTSI